MNTGGYIPTDNEKMCRDLFERLKGLKSVDALWLHSEFMFHKDQPDAEEQMFALCEHIVKHERNQIDFTFKTIRDYFYNKGKP